MIDTQFVMLAGVHRNGSAMISRTCHDLPDMTYLGEIFATTTGSTQSLRQQGIKWKVALNRKIFGMDRTPMVRQPIISSGTLMAPPESCNKIFDVVTAGDTQSELSHHLNTEEKVIFCKVAFQHCPYFYTTWDYMFEDPSIKMIWIKRNNPLHTLISGMNAYKHQQWQTQLHETPQISQVSINIRYMLEYLTFEDANTSFFDIYFRDRDNVLTINYEEMAYNWDQEISRVFDFIGVEVEDPVELSIRQQIPTGRHTSMIENIEEVTEVLQGTRWEYCLDE